MKIYTSFPQSVILSAITKLEDFVKVTYGAAGRGILIDNGLYQSVIDDGFSVVEEFELDDELENTVISYIKEATRKTNSRAGDGTTTSLLIMCSLIKEALNGTKNTIGYIDYVAIVDDLSKGLQVAIKKIQKLSKKITKVEELEAIALNVYRNKDIAKIVAKTIHEVGVDGIITIDNSATYETTAKVVMGMTIDRGYISPHMSTNGAETTLNRPKIIITDEVIARSEQIVPILSSIVKSGCKDILIIADTVEGEALNTIITNRIQNGLNCVVIKAPGFAEQRIALLEDIATVTNSVVLSSRLGRPFSTIKEVDCGTAQKIIVDKDETTVIGGAGSKEEIKRQSEMIKAQIKQSTPIEKGRLEERIARLTSGIGIISVGALTDTETRAIMAKVDDVIHATQLAYKEGVIEGGGLTMSSLNTGSVLLDEALKSPRRMLEENGEGYITKGVLDSSGVIIAGIESAVSVASGLIICGGIITNKKEKKDEE